jgi:O-antigen/teichoic acid export membrane protein
MTAAPPAAAAADEHQGQLAKLARRGTASVVGAGFSALFGVLLVVCVTNGFSPTVAGTLFAATSAFLILEALALLGTDTGLVKWLPAQLASGRAADVPRTLVISAVPVAALSLCVAGVLYAAAPALAPHLVGTDAASTMELMLRVLAVVLPVSTLLAMALAATRGTGSMRPTVVVENIGRFGGQSLAVLVVSLAGGGALALTLGWSLPYVLGLAVAGVWLRLLVARRTTQRDTPTPWPTLTREFWAYTAPRAIARVTQTALKRSDIVIVAALAGPADAALYTAATRFVVLGQLFVQSVQQALSPQLSALFARDETKAANSVFQAATRWSMLAAWPLYLVMAGFAQTLMVVFGDGYTVASDVVIILSLSMLFATACGPVDSVLLMAGRSWLSLANNAAALAVNVALNLVLIPLYGIRGAAISWSVAILLRNLLPLIQVKRQLGMSPFTRPTVLVGAAATACFGSVGVLVALVDLPAGDAVVILAIGLTAYLLVTWSMRASLGLDAFRSALHRRRGRSAVGLPAGDAEDGPPFPQFRGCPGSGSRPSVEGLGGRCEAPCPRPRPRDLTWGRS